MSRRELAKEVITCIAMIAALFYVCLSDLGATPCIVSFETEGALYFEVELNGDLYRVDASGAIFEADLAALPDGRYQASITAVGETDPSAPVHFTLTKQSDKNKCYYSITPEPGYEQFFSEPLVMVINTKAKKSIGR